MTFFRDICITIPIIQNRSAVSNHRVKPSLVLPFVSLISNQGDIDLGKCKDFDSHSDTRLEVPFNCVGLGKYFLLAVCQEIDAFQRIRGGINRCCVFLCI